jgi:tetratricopeptide (TPR) repeat protein
MFKRALALREEQGKPPQIRIARWMVARVLRSLERYDEALAIQQGLAAETAQAGEGDPYIDEELGECLLALGRGSEAQPYFAKAYAALSQDDLLMKYEAPRLARLRALANS